MSLILIIILAMIVGPFVVNLLGAFLNAGLQTAHNMGTLEWKLARFDEATQRHFKDMTGWAWTDKDRKDYLARRSIERYNLVTCFRKD